MKRALSILLSLILFLSLLPAAPARAASVENLTYSITDGKVTITGCNESASGNLVIPDTIKGYPVTGIGDWAFAYCDSLTSVTIPDSVTSIGDGVFDYCSSLTDIIVSKNNPSYSSDSYGVLFNKDKTSLIQSPRRISGAYTIPDSVTDIGDGAFCDCDGLTSVTIPDSVTSIGREAFSCCDGLTSVTIPDSVTSIGHEAFSACYNLTGVVVSKNNPSYSSDARGVLFNKEQTWLIQAPMRISGAYTIPTGVTSIGDWAFSSCIFLTSVTIPDSVTSIGELAFSGCNSLTGVTIGDSVTSIGEDAFSYCASLTNVSIPDSVTSIGEYAFYECPSLNYNIYDNGKYLGNEQNPYVVLMGTTDNSITAFNIHPDAKVIGYSAFNNCDSLNSVTIPDSITSIGDYAFSCCASLASVTIPDSVTSIGERAFSSCLSLTGIIVSKNNPAYSSASYGVLFNKDQTSLIQAPGRISGAYTIPDSVTSIGDAAFEYCWSLTSVTIPDSVTSIGGSAFYQCVCLTSVTIPDSVTSIGWGAFYQCVCLTSVTIGDSVTSIGNAAFSGCDSLTGIIVSKNNPAYSSDSDGILFNKDQSLLIQMPGGTSGTYSIPDSVTSIGAGAFSYCDRITSITIPDSVTSIGNAAFSDCDNLTSVTIPASVTSVGGFVFTCCDSLADIYFTGNAPSLGGCVFETVSATLCYHSGTTGWDTVTSDQLTGGWGEITLQAVDHFWSEYTCDNNATCTQDGTCSAVCVTCGEVKTVTDEGSALGHSYKNGSCILCGMQDPDSGTASCTGTLVTYGTGQVLLTLTPVGETVPAATLTTIDGSYSLAVAPGEYILTASQEGTVTRTYTLTLTEGETAQEIKLACPGDVSGDGRLNVGDVAKIYAHAKRTAEFADDYQLLCADYNGDGRINVGDAARVYALIKSK